MTTRSESFPRVYFFAAAVVLCLVAFAKVFALLNPTADASLRLSFPDPIFPFLSAQTLLWFAVQLEIIAAILMFSKAKMAKKFLIIGVISSLFVSYRFGLWLGNFPQPCDCLGGSLEWLGLSGNGTRTLGLAILLFLWIPSAAWPLHFIWRERKALLLSICFATFLDVKSAETFILEGSIGGKFYDWETGNLRDRQPNAEYFTARIQRNGRWQMRFEPRSDDIPNIYEFGFDGENIYGIFYPLVLHKAPSAAQMQQMLAGDDDGFELEVEKRFASPDEVDSAPAVITPGAYPFDVFEISQIRTIWFALASSHFLDSTNSNRMPAFWFGNRRNPLAFTYENEIERFDKFPNLPKKVRFKTIARDALPADIAAIPEIDFPQDLHSKMNLKKEIAVLEHLQAGHLGAEFACLSHTDLGGATLPLRFELKLFWEGVAVSYFKSNELSSVTFGQITNVIHTNLPAFGKPKVRSKILTIDDYRFRNRAKGGERNFLYYGTTNNVFPDFDDAHVQLHFKWRKQKEREAEWNRFGRITSLLLILLVVAIPFIVWQRIRRRKNLPIE